MAMHRQAGIHAEQGQPREGSGHRPPHLAYSQLASLQFTRCCHSCLATVQLRPYWHCASGSWQRAQCRRNSSQRCCLRICCLRASPAPSAPAICTAGSEPGRQSVSQSASQAQYAGLTLAGHLGTPMQGQRQQKEGEEYAYENSMRNVNNRGWQHPPHCPGQQTQSPAC